MEGNIVILCATSLESEAIRRGAGEAASAVPGVSLCWPVSGMGASSTAYATAKAIRKFKPALIIQAGIAGAFLGEGNLAAGECVLVRSDYQSDLGAWRPETGHFEAFSQPRIDCPYIGCFGLDKHFKTVRGRSCNVPCSPNIPVGAGQIETMEGMAFFEVCAAEQVAYLQLRSISNYVGQPRDEWRIADALEVLDQGLGKLLELVLKR